MRNFTEQIELLRIKTKAFPNSAKIEYREDEKCGSRKDLSISTNSQED